MSRRASFSSRSPLNGLKAMQPEKLFREALKKGFVVKANNSCSTDPSTHTRSKHHLLVRNLPGLSTLSSQGRSSTHCGFDYTTSEELGKSPGAMARLGDLGFSLHATEKKE